MTHTTFQIGRLRCHTLEGGRQRLDGGAMFGIVPKALWGRRIAADERNRIPLALRCLLVEHDDGLVLIDTGLGNKETPRFHDIYGVENAGTRGATALEDALDDLGYAPEDVEWVINTHLHFDHAGGNTRRAPDGGVETSFPRATYVVQRGELHFASHANERTAGSYPAHNFASLDFRLLDGETELLAGLHCLPTPGHVPHHQSVLIESAGERALFIGDVTPTTRHLPLPWIMGYDVEPLVTLETKRQLYARALAQDWLLWFQHDPDTAAARLRVEGTGLALVDPVVVG